MEFTKVHPQFKKLHMVCKSISKEASRYAINHIEVNKKHIVGTDGRRMALLDNFGIKVSRYEVVKCTNSKILIYPVESEGKFPKYEDILPEDVKDEDRSTLPDDLTIAHYRISKAGVCISIDYLKDYIEADQYHVTTKDRPVSIYADGFIAVVMPVNAD